MEADERLKAQCLQLRSQQISVKRVTNTENKTFYQLEENLSGSHVIWHNNQTPSTEYTEYMRSKTGVRHNRIYNIRCILIEV